LEKESLQYLFPGRGERGEGAFPLPPEDGGKRERIKGRGKKKIFSPEGGKREGRGGGPFLTMKRVRKGKKGKREKKGGLLYLSRGEGGRSGFSISLPRREGRGKGGPIFDKKERGDSSLYNIKGRGEVLPFSGKKKEKNRKRRRFFLSLRGKKEIKKEREEREITS